MGLFIAFLFICIIIIITGFEIAKFIEKHTNFIAEQTASIKAINNKLDKISEQLYRDINNNEYSKTNKCKRKY